MHNKHRHKPEGAKSDKKVLSKFTKRALSVAGASIVFVTFLVNDTKREHLREILGSIDSALSVYEIRRENHKSFFEIRRFEREFVKSKAVPPTGNAVVHLDGYVAPIELYSWNPSPDKIGWETMGGVQAGIPPNKEVLETIQKLAAQLQLSPERKATLDELSQDELDLEKKATQIANEGHDFERKQSSKEDLAGIGKFNTRLVDLKNNFLDHSRKLQLESIHIVDDAEKASTTAQAKYKEWTVIFYVFSGLGWLIGVTGIVIGADAESGAKGLTDL